jgi:hypothetical protein
VNVAIISTGEYAKKVYQSIMNTENIYDINYLVDKDYTLWGNEISTCEVISPGKACHYYRIGKVNKFIMPSMSEEANNKIVDIFNKLGVEKEDFLYAPIDFLDENMTDSEKVASICEFSKRKELETVEIHAAEHCNLNCKNCSMFCGLVKEPSFQNYDKMVEGLVNLKKYFKHVKKFRIIGGEPLLNKDLYKYFKPIKQLFPFTEIRLITNGILVNKMSEELINSLIDNDVIVVVTVYKSMADKAEAIHDFLKKNNIKHELTDIVMEFQKIYNYRGNGNIEDNFNKCHWRGGCATLYNNFYSICFVPFVIKYLSKEFDLNIDENNDYIDLSAEGLTTEKIRKMMSEPIGCCRFCNFDGSKEEWQVIGKHKKTKITDWSV